MLPALISEIAVFPPPNPADVELILDVETISELDAPIWKLSAPASLPVNFPSFTSASKDLPL